MQYSTTDSGVFYMTEKERDERRYDRKAGEREVSLNKDELPIFLQEVGINNPLGPKRKLQQSYK
jgi:hypothetical protein